MRHKGCTKIIVPESLQTLVKLAMKNATERWIESLVDKNSFLSFGQKVSEQEEQPLYRYGPEIVTGLAKVEGRPVAIYAQNTNINRGYISKQGAQKIIRLMDRAHHLRIPIIAFLASPGIEIESELESGNAYTEIISKNIALSGVIPQLAVIMGPTLGAPAYSSVLMDMSVFNKNRSFLMVTSPTVVKEAIGEKVTMSELGGSAMHASVTGLADFLESTIHKQVERVKSLIGFFPLNQAEKPPLQTPCLPVKPMPDIPNSPQVAFDMLTLIEAIVDNSSLSEYKQQFGKSMICGFAYLDGYPVGIVANQSIRLSGAIDSDAAQKSSRFIRLCDAYNIPILTLIDVPGFMPGKREEQRGLLRHGARFCAAMQTMVPRMSLVVRKCYGAAAFLMMQTKAQGGDLVLALEGSTIGAMGSAASSKVQEIDKSGEKSTKSEDSLAQAYSMGLVDEVIFPSEIRQRLSEHLVYLFYKVQVPRLERKHFIDP